MTPALLGYSDRFSVAPGETIRFMVSAEVPSYRASLVRLIIGDENPAGPGYREAPVASDIDGEYAGRRQALTCGSYARIPSSPLLDLVNGFTLQAWIWPTTPNKPGSQGLIARWSDSDQRGFVFGLDDTGHLSLQLGFANAHSVCVKHPGPPLARWRWAFVAATFEFSPIPTPTPTPTPNPAPSKSKSKSRFRHRASVSGEQRGVRRARVVRPRATAVGRRTARARKC